MEKILKRFKVKCPFPNIGSIVTIQGKQWKVLRWNTETGEIIVKEI